MPVVLRHKGYRFAFFSDEGDPLEPMHIHVSKAGTEVKFWLHPFVTVAHNKRVPLRDVRELMEIVQQNRAKLERAWNAHFRT